MKACLNKNGQRKETIACYAHAFAPFARHFEALDKGIFKFFPAIKVTLMTSLAMPKDFFAVQSEGFGGFAGPVMSNANAEDPVFLLDIAKQHLNGDQSLHGGMMMSLMSIVMGEVAQMKASARSAGTKTRPLSLNCDFVSAGKPGERVEGRAIITRATRSVLFMSGSLTVGERILMTATGVYAIKAAGEK